MSYRLSLLRLQLSNLNTTAIHQKCTIISNFDFDPLRVELGPYSSFFFDETNSKNNCHCAIDCFLIGIKQFLYAIHQLSEKRINISTVKLLLVLSIY